MRSVRTSTVFIDELIDLLCEYQQRSSATIISNDQQLDGYLVYLDTCFVLCTKYGSGYQIGQRQLQSEVLRTRNIMCSLQAPPYLHVVYSVQRYLTLHYRMSYTYTGLVAIRRPATGQST